MRTLVVLLLILGRFVGDIYTSAGIDRHIRDRQGLGIRNEQSADRVVMDGQFLNPCRQADGESVHQAVAADVNNTLRTIF